MQLSFVTKSLALPLFVALCAVPACGDDKGGDTETAGVSTQSTQTMGTTSAATDDTASATEDTTSATEDTASTVTSPTTTTAPTTMGPTTNTTEDTTTGGPAGQYCQEACVGDADCMIGGVDMGWTCQDSRCTTDAGKCSTDTQCNALFSGWATDCAAQADCQMGFACVDIGEGMGKCAVTPSDFLMCETLMMEELQVPAIEGGMDIAVCGKTGAKCDNEVCTDPCESNAECPAQGGHPMCNAGTGKCECTSNEDCAATGLGYLTTCNNGVCGCGSDADCVTTMGSDKCFEGVCGCSTVDVCPAENAFDGTTKVCEGV